MIYPIKITGTTLISIFASKQCAGIVLRQLPDSRAGCPLENRASFWLLLGLFRSYLHTTDVSTFSEPTIYFGVKALFDLVEGADLRYQTNVFAGSGNTHPLLVRLTECFSFQRQEVQAFLLLVTGASGRDCILSPRLKSRLSYWNPKQGQWLLVLFWG